MHAFEMTGTVNAQGQLALDQPLPLPQAGRVRMIVLLEDQNDEQPTEQLQPYFSEPTQLSSYRAFVDDPESQDFWHTLADIFGEDPEEDWTQLLKSARRKSVWM
jgi:hypothetical protein